MKTELKRQLTGDEDRRKTVYKDSKGLDTIAVGRLVDSNVPGAGLRDDEIDYLLNNDIDDRINELNKRFPWFQNLDDVRKGVLVNMAFQLGVSGLTGFTKTIGLIHDGMYDAAAAAMLDSKWAKIDSPARAKRLSEQMRTGIWQYSK